MTTLVDDETNELWKELISRSTALVLTSDFKFPDIKWEYPTMDTNRSGKFLKHIEENFLIQVLREPTRKGALLDLLFVNKRSGDCWLSWSQ